MSGHFLDLSCVAPKADKKIPPVFPANTHICHFYRTKEDLLDLLVPFFREGLARHEFCLWGVTFPLSVEEAKASLEKVVKDIDSYEKTNQLEIFDIGALYGADDFDAIAVRDGFLNKVKISLSKGWKGFRCDGITSGVKPNDWKNLQIYEEEVTRTLPGSVTALCSYNVADLTPHQLMNVANTHPATIMKESKGWYIIDISETTFDKRKAA